MSTFEGPADRRGQCPEDIASANAAASARNRSGSSISARSEPSIPALQSASSSTRWIALRAWTSASCARSCDAGRTRRRRAGRPRPAATGSVASGRRSSRSTAESTRGGGRKQLRGTVNRPAGAASSRSFTRVGAVLLVARGRGHAVGDLGLHHHGRRGELGQLLEEAQHHGGGNARRAGWRRARSAGRTGSESASGVDRRRRRHARPPAAGSRRWSRRARAAAAASRSTATTAPALPHSATVSVPSPGPTSRTVSSPVSAASSRMRPDDVVVDEEVLAERLLGGESVALQDLDRRRGGGEPRVRHASRGR